MLLRGTDGVPTYVMLYNGAMAPGAVSHADTGGHTHRWEHAVYVLQGSGTLVCEGKSYTVFEGDGVLVPAECAAPVEERDPGSDAAGDLQRGGVGGPRGVSCAHRSATRIGDSRGGTASKS